MYLPIGQGKNQNGTMTCKKQLTLYGILDIYTYIKHSFEKTCTRFVQILFTKLLLFDSLV